VEDSKAASESAGLLRLPFCGGRNVHKLIVQACAEFVCVLHPILTCHQRAFVPLCFQLFGKSL